MNVQEVDLASSLVGFNNTLPKVYPLSYEKCKTEGLTTCRGFYIEMSISSFFVCCDLFLRTTHAMLQCAN